MGMLRVLLALSVVINHCGPVLGLELVGGKIAVQSFFIISGFYMSIVLNEKYIGTNASYKLFITNRIIRLYPIYWLCLIAAVVTYLVIYLVTPSHFASVELAVYSSAQVSLSAKLLLIISSLVLLGQELFLFLGVSENGALFFTKNYLTTTPQLHTFVFLPQAWTLSLEMLFYFVAPVILRRGIKTIGLLIILSLALRFYLYNNLDLKNDPWTYRFFPTELFFFLTGYLSYLIYRKNKNTIQNTILPWIVLSFVFIASACYFLIPEMPLRYVPFTLKEIVYLTTIALAVPYLFATFKKTKWDNAIGELSYPMYISHILVKNCVLIVCNKFKWTLSDGTVIALLTVLFALFLNLFVAKPIERFRQSRIARPQYS